MLNLNVKDTLSMYVSPDGITDDLCLHVSRLRSLISQRLEACRGKRLLLTFDGSIFDELAYFFLSQCYKASDFDVICSIRPCMDERLRDLVVGFSQRNGYKLVTYNTDCTINYRRFEIDDHQCTNISPYIEDFFSLGGGIQILGTLSDDIEVQSHARRNWQYPGINSFRGKHEELYWKSAKNEQETLFLFHNLLPTEILACYISFTDDRIEEWRVPLCYLPCEFESHKTRLITLIKHCQDKISKELKCDSFRFRAMQSSLSALT